MIQSEIKKIYGQLLAGRLPVGNGNASEVVFNHIYGLTGQKNMHAYTHLYGGYVYFFAVESMALASCPAVYLPFAEYLPGQPLYEGDGVYLMVDEGFAISMWIEGSGLRLICNSEDVIQESLKETDLPVIEVTGQGGPMLTSMPQKVFGLSEAFGRWLMRGSLVVLALSSLTFVGVQTVSVVSQARQQTQTTEKAVEQELNNTLQQLNIQQPLARQIARVQKVSATAIRAGGWIEVYSLKGEKNETFEVVLPSWVSQDYLDSLGRDVVTELRDIEGLLLVRKEGKGKK
jgi:cell division protein FtsL